MSDNTNIEIIQLVDTAIDNWLAVNTPDQITKSVHSQLNKFKDEITLKLLGFDKSYGDRTWKLDHCNGRAGNSPAGDYLRDTQSTIIKQWLDKVPLPELSPSQLDKLSLDFTDVYLRALRKSLITLVEAKAKEDSQRLLDEIINTDSIENYLKTKELIQS